MSISCRLSGWASGSKYSLIGALRAAAQVVSYELILGLALLAIVVTAGDTKLSTIVQKQHESVWFILLQPVAFVLYLIAAIAMAAAAFGLLVRVRGYDSAFRLWNVHTYGSPFLDLRLITASAESYAQGYDPALQNPADPEKRHGHSVCPFVGRWNDAAR